MPLFTPLAKKLLRSKQEALPGVEVSRRAEKKKTRESKKAGRKAIIILFLFTTAASGLFYLKTEIPLWWQKLTSPATFSSLPGRQDFDPTPTLEEFRSLTKDLRGTYGFYVYNLGSKEAYGVNEDEVFTAASLIKLPVMLLTYQEAEKGSLDLEEHRSRLESMGKRSDNTAFNQMVSILGESKIQTLIDDLGMSQTSFAKNDTSPADIGLFFQKLYEEDLISREHQEEFLDFLTDTIWEDRIPAGIPDGVKVAHKIGTELGTYSDAGIIFTDQPFILVIMSDGARETEASEVSPKISQSVWEFETSR